jgi:putative DNA methylase
MVRNKKKLIEVALPLDAINKAAAAEKQPGIGAHPRGLHLWWARRPLAAAVAVIFSQMVDDPSSNPDLFPTEKLQLKERQRLFEIINKLVQWENSTNEDVLENARKEIWQSWRRCCAENADHPLAKEIFNRNKLPAFHDPFAGGGALPLEAQRLGLESYASDLNPVAVLINKAMIEIPPKFEDQLPVNPESRRVKELFDRKWKGVEGLAEDVRYYGEWVRNEAKKRIGNLYPTIHVTPEMVRTRQDLKPYLDRELNVIAWIWVRTVKSPNPAFTSVHVPLASTFMLSTKVGKEAYIEPIIEKSGYRFTVKVGKPKNIERAKKGTKLARGANFECLMSGIPMEGDYIKAEGIAGRLGVRLMAIVAEGDRGRIYLEPTSVHEAAARNAKPEWKPDTPLAPDLRALWTPLYGLTTYGDLFTNRQLVALTTFSDLLREVLELVKQDAAQVGLPYDDKPLRENGIGSSAYGEAVVFYLAFAIDRLADYNSSIATWKPSGEQVMQTYKRQGIPMTWDFPESNVFGLSAICWKNSVKYTADNLQVSGSIHGGKGFGIQLDAGRQELSLNKVISTDPPYYDNIGYADLSDFFYVWLRQSLRSIYPDLFTTVAVPKAEELVASPYRHGGKEKAGKFFLEGMTQAMHQLANLSHQAFPITIYYAFKQSETEDESGTTRTGWETFLNAIILAGFAINGTWPIRTELANKVIGLNANILASSIVLVCRKRDTQAPVTTRREFLNELKLQLPKALTYLQRGNIAPVDFAQAAIGPGMAVYTKYTKVLDAEGKPLTVREALTIINETLDLILTEQEGDFDSDSRWALTWFEQSGFSEGEYGVAEQLSKSKNTSVAGMVEAGILESKRGKVHLLRPEELPINWDPTKDSRVTHWETVHQLIRALSSGGESAAAELVSKLGGKAETARELCYRLYTICERKKRTSDALAYNGLVQSWPEIVRLASQESRKTDAQGTLFSTE